MSPSTIWALEIMPPPPMPCTTRPQISISMLDADAEMNAPAM